MWVAFDGRATITRDGAFELAERLARRYWDMADPEEQTTVESWRKTSAGLRVIEIIPTSVRWYGESGS
jgi:hypothetical protein